MGSNEPPRMPERIGRSVNAAEALAGLPFDRLGAGAGQDLVEGGPGLVGAASLLVTDAEPEPVIVALACERVRALHVLKVHEGGTVFAGLVVESGGIEFLARKPQVNVGTD